MGVGDIIGDLFVRISADLKGLSESIGPGGKADKELEGFTSRVNSGLLGIAKLGAVGGLIGIAAIGAGLFVATKSAIDFEASMKLLQTQAGASSAEVANMSKAVLGLAGQVGTSPEELAKGLYHLESAGFRGATAMQALRIAAEGAKVGQANLEDVTNALDAVLVAGVPEAKNMAGAMGELNAIVGAGDMRMQDLADAMGTGILASAKEFGLGLKDVGAALAVMGDNNIRGSDAATKLRMSISLLGALTPKAAKELEKLGITDTEMADKMRSGGLIAALEDLKGKMDKSGMKASELADIISRSFGGGKSAGTILLLLEQLDRMKSKEGEITKGAGDFNQAWQNTRQNVGFKWDQFTAGLQAAGIQIGTVLLPYVTQLLSQITPLVPLFADWATKALPPLIDGIKDFAEKYGPPVLDFLKWGVANFDTIKTAVLLIGGAWVAWNVALAVTRAMSLIGFLVQLIAQSYIAASATEGMSVAQWLLNVALDANPIGLVIIGLTLLAAAFIWAYQNVGPFRDGVNELWGGLQDFASWVANDFGPLMDGIGTLLHDVFSGNWGALGSDLSYIKEAFGGFNNSSAGVNTNTGKTKVRAFATGGIVPGPIGAPQLALIHGGERVLTPEQQRLGIGGGGDMTKTNALLNAILGAVTAQPGGQTGVEAALYKAVHLSGMNRARGMAGA